MMTIHYESTNLFGTLLLLKLLGVKVQLSSLKNVTITATGLAGSGGDAGEQTAGAESIIKGGVKHTALGTDSELSLGMLGLLLDLRFKYRKRIGRIR
jgi:hypothetical protein